ncbi:hypothetical protein EIN_151750 [Entamoeba invadens IP1]|uniref:Uncharacterized protein n=1 Tax=Entamoeba invadens IP1 TaxID=370355 RepID=A0A0A1UC13_ENTIV|nr:hypothetical protein EIN_151750 [Entamoeba invadens IP1]ELP91248.1 hypothetical protein EIN_151750 [Entamoeba invadens IP1]|eukprot:XP_004258019.1 hypothetical protein EIN_151750 [Entamoeba invadens IP1]
MSIIPIIQAQHYGNFQTQTFINAMKDILQCEDTIENSFVRSVMEYRMTHNIKTIQETVTVFCEYCIVGDKTKERLWNIFGSTFSYICEILFSNDSDKELTEEKIHLMSLMRYFVKSCLFTQELVSTQYFLENIFYLMKDDRLFVSSCLLIESILEQREHTFDLENIEYIDSIISNADTLHFGIFLIVVNYLLYEKDKSDEHIVMKNTEKLAKCGVIDRALKMLSLSSVSLAIIHLLENSCIEETDKLIANFYERCDNEMETYPDVDISFEGVQGIYACDIVSNIVFVISTILSNLDDKFAKEMLKDSDIGVVLESLYQTIGIENMQTPYRSDSENVVHLLFTQFIRLLSNIPIENIFEDVQEDGGVIGSIVEDIQFGKIDESIQVPLLTVIENISRECKEKEQIFVGKTLGVIKMATKLLCGEKNENKRSMMYDMLGTLVRGSQENVEEFILSLEKPFGEFLSDSVEDCISSSVFFRTMMLNFVENKGFHLRNAFEKEYKIIQEYIPVFFRKLTNHVAKEGVDSNTMCCMNTSVLILGMKSVTIKDFLGEDYYNENFMGNLKTVVRAFVKKYPQDNNIEDLCKLTQTNHSVWYNAIRCLETDNDNENVY